MTKTTGILTPPHNPAVESKTACKRCDVIKKQAEAAFTELRSQTDQHIAAVQRKSKEENATELERLRMENQQMIKDLNALREQEGPRDQAMKVELEKVKSDAERRLHNQRSAFEDKLTEVSADYESRILKIHSRLDEAERHGEKEMEAIARSHKKDVVLLESRIKELLSENDELLRQLRKAELDIHTIKSESHKTQLQIDRATHSAAAEREAALEQVVALKVKISSMESAKTEADLERAKLDLAYRRRIGEMESEVRRTEIESVRLRREILRLNQRVEQLETDAGHSNWISRTARSRILPIESGLPSLHSGRIRRVATPVVRNNDVEEVSSPTSSN